MKWLKRLGISLTIAFFVVCCGAVLLFNWGALGWKALSVPTASMRPNIPPGSLVLMHRVPVASIHTRDVITYINPLNMKSTISHRVIKTYKLDGKIPAFITKGDANPTPDRPVVGGQVLGKVVWHAPAIGGWLMWSKGWVGLIILVYIPATLLMIEEIQRLNKYYKQSKAYKSGLVLERLRLIPKKKHHVLQATTISIALVACSALFAFPAQALLRSNTVTLGPNKLTVAKITPPPPKCPTGGNSTTVTITTNGGGNNNVSVGNSSTQTATSGSATVTGNTNGGSATSGSATNTNCTTINVNIH